MSITDDDLVDLVVRADLAEAEAADLRLKVRKLLALIVHNMDATHRWNRSLEPLFERMLELDEITKHEVEHHRIAADTDEATLADTVASYRKAYGACPFSDPIADEVDHETTA